MIVYAPQDSNYLELANFSHKLFDVGDAEHITIDFSKVTFVTPAWCVIVGGLLRQFRESNPALKRKVINFKHLTFAAHIGFFDYFGANFGNATDEAPGSATYIPISIRSVPEIKATASDRLTAVGEVLHTEAERLSSMLTRSDTGDLQDTLAYSMREVLRNVVEHSEAEEFVFSAQFWPAKRLVEVVVADQGIGLANSLRENPNLAIATDESALEQAVLPGVSSKAWRRGRRHDEWANSGYGLFMTERLCSLGGSFGLISGTSMLLRKEGTTTAVPFRWAGTVVVLQLDTSKLASLSSRLSDFRDEGAAVERQLKNFATGPSRASTSAKPSKWKLGNE